VIQQAHMNGKFKSIMPLTVEYSTDAIVAEGLASRAEMEALVAEIYEFARNPMTIIGGPRIIQSWGVAES